MHLVNRFTACLMLLFVAAGQTAAQEISNLDIVKKAIEAAGGETWRRPQTLQLSGTATLYWQGREHKMTTYKMWRVFPSDNDNARNANGKVRFDAFSGEELFFRIAFDGKNTMQNLSSEAKANEEMLRWSNNFGFSIFRFVENEGFKLTRLPDDAVDGNECYFIKITDPKNSQTIFGIDKKTHWIRLAAFDTPLGFHQRIYSDFKYHKNPRFVQPRRLRIFNDGVKTADIYWAEFKVNASIPDQVFTVR